MTENANQSSRFLNTFPTTRVNWCRFGITPSLCHQWNLPFIVSFLVFTCEASNRLKTIANYFSVPAVLYSYHFTFGRHRRRQLFSSFHASACPSLCPWVRPERRYHPNSLRIAAIGLKFGGMTHSTMRQVAIQNGYVQLILRRPRNFENFYDRIGPGRWLISGDVRKSQNSLKFGGMMQCTMKGMTIWNGHAQPMFAFFWSQPAVRAVVLWSSCKIALVSHHSTDRLIFPILSSKMP